MAGPLVEHPELILRHLLGIPSIASVSYTVIEKLPVVSMKMQEDEATRQVRSARIEISLAIYRNEAFDQATDMHATKSFQATASKSKLMEWAQKRRTVQWLLKEVPLGSFRLILAHHVGVFIGYHWGHHHPNINTSAPRSYLDNGAAIASN